jgi:hypothetical protein
MDLRLPTTRARPAWAVLALWALHGADIAAQVSPERPDTDESTVTAAVAPPTVDAEPLDEAATGDGSGFWGSRSPRRRVIPGLWGMHFFDQQPLRPFWTRGAGFQASGWFGGAFMNSYDDLSLIAGIEREWGAWRAGAFAMGVGYRAGLLSGYDRELFALADKTPVLPFVGLDVWLQTGPVGVDVFYVYRALAIEASIAY